MKRIITTLILLGIAAGALAANPYLMVIARKNAGGGDYLTDLAHRWTFDSDLTDSVGSADMSAVGAGAASGGYLVLDGINDGTTCDRSVLAGKSTVTVTAWIRPDSEAQDHTIFVHDTFLGGNTIFWVDEAATDTITFLVTDNDTDGTGSQVGTSGLTRDGSTWSFVSVVMSLGATVSIKSYLNATLENDYSGANIDEVRDWGGSTLVYWGRDIVGTAAKVFAGEMDDIRIYNAALTQPQIEAIYNATTH